MTFGEFDAACSGFEAFHAPQEEEGGAPSVEAHKRALGLMN